MIDCIVRTDDTRESRSLPMWTELDQSPCADCPLQEVETHCPAAVDLAP